ncbi:MAG: molybdenum cofactor synthesis domain protein [Planctomycetaceae bacterium]|nr:molybdenum cofactor synthesis domain protein [Planctomycetaceae bacterium]
MKAIAVSSCVFLVAEVVRLRANTLKRLNSHASRYKKQEFNGQQTSSTTRSPHPANSMSQQEQFLDVIDRDEAEKRFRAALSLVPLGEKEIPTTEGLGRVLARDVLAHVDVPSFDRANYDGFAVRAHDTFGASEMSPRTVRLQAEFLDAGTPATGFLAAGEAITIATGGMVPRGADAILMIEHSEVKQNELFIRRSVTPGFGIAFAGTDIARGETVLRAGAVLTSRETGVLAAIGEHRIFVWRRPRVAIISTGNEIISPGEPMRPAGVYDSNSQVLADAVRELGGAPRCWGIVRDEVTVLRSMLQAALAESDLVLLSGGTSKGKGDLCYRVVDELTDPGIVVHGVALKPGKPLCLAVTGGKPVAILPGFPTSAIFTFHEFVAPVIRLFGGRPAASQETISATMAMKTNSEIGRTEYLLVGLVKTERGLSAFPMGKGSGSVTTFSRADGFVTIPRHTEIVEAGQEVRVRLIGQGLQIADLIVIGSHCVGLDFLLSQLQRRQITSKLLTVGSSAGLLAAKRGECDIAGIHLLDPESGTYNSPFLSDAVDLVKGYGRLQGILFRRDDARFEGKSLVEILQLVTDPEHANCVMVNRNQGSGTRILIDRLLAGKKPNGYAVQPSNHNAVAAAIAQGRADWGLAIESVAKANGLGFLPYQEECYDFVIPKSRRDRPAVRAFLELLGHETTQRKLAELGFRVTPE